MILPLGPICVAVRSPRIYGPVRLGAAPVPSVHAVPRSSSRNGGETSSSVLPSRARQVFRARPRQNGPRGDELEQLRLPRPVLPSDRLRSVIVAEVAENADDVPRSPTIATTVYFELDPPAVRREMRTASNCSTTSPRGGSGSALPATCLPSRRRQDLDRAALPQSPRRLAEDAAPAARFPAGHGCLSVVRPIGRRDELTEWPLSRAARASRAFSSAR